MQVRGFGRPRVKTTRMSPDAQMAGVRKLMIPNVIPLFRNTTTMCFKVHHHVSRSARSRFKLLSTNIPLPAPKSGAQDTKCVELLKAVYDMGYRPLFL